MSVVRFLDLEAMHAPLRPQLDQAWAEAIEQSQFIGGDAVEHFEARWAAACCRRYAVGVANGTDALALILQAYGVGPGDEVILAANTFIATAEAVTAAGATPVFADVDVATLLVTADTVEACRTARTVAAVIVHLYGQLPDMDSLELWAARHGIVLVEDAAQAHLASWNGRVAGSFGLAGGFSFYPGKNLGAFGDGGAVVTDDADLAEGVRCLANHGRSLQDRYLHDLDGCNSRLDALQATVLGIKLEALPRWNEQRRAVARRYRSNLEGLPGIDMVRIDPRGQAVHHLEVVQINDRELVQSRLRGEGIETAIHYPVPCHRQRPFAKFARGALPVAEAAAARVLVLMAN